MKCTTCGMGENQNPAHSDTYGGPGKHKFHTAGKSSTFFEHLQDNSSLIAWGGSVKALGDGKLGGFAILYTTDQDPDTTGDFFDNATEYWLDEAKAVRPVIYDHGLDVTLKSRKLARGTVELKDAGVWFETQLALRDDYEKAIYEMAERGKLGISTGSAPHLIKREQVGKAMHIKSWPIVEVSLTPMPVEPRTQVVALKSYADERPETDLLSTIIKGGQGSGNFGHSGRPGQRGGSAQQFYVPQAHEPFTAKHEAIAQKIAEAEVQNAMMGEGGITREDFQGVAFDIEGIQNSDLADKIDNRAYQIAKKLYRGRKSVESLKADFHPYQGNGDTCAYCDQSMSEGDHKKSLEDHSVKGVFEDALAQKSATKAELDSALEQVCQEIVDSVKSYELLDPVTDAVTEYAARLIPMVVEQMQQGEGPFHLRSFYSTEDSPLQVFLSVKSALETEANLYEHSTMVVSALGEFANQTASLVAGVKAWHDRCKAKIEFRAEDPSKKCGRVISAATQSELSKAQEQIPLAQLTELHGLIGQLVGMADTKSVDDVALQIQFLLAEAQHENEMAGLPLA